MLMGKLSCFPFQFSFLHSMKNVLICAAALAVLSGCATPIPTAIDNSVSSAMLDQNIVLVLHPTPDFIAARPGKAVLGIAGAFWMRATGNNLIARHHIPDPAFGIGQALANELATTRGARLVRSPVTLETLDATAIAASVKGGGSYALAVQTQWWNFSYFGTDWDHYRLKYMIRARLLETATGKILADSDCEYAPDSKAQEPTYQELVNDGAAGLKRELDRARAQCLATLRGKLLNL
jgi:hypothetical protein